MFYIVEKLQGFLATMAFRRRCADIGVGSSEHTVKQTLGEPNEATRYIDEGDGLETFHWRYKDALGPRVDFVIVFISGKWSHVYTAQYPHGWPKQNYPCEMLDSPKN